MDYGKYIRMMPIVLNGTIKSVQAGRKREWNTAVLFIQQRKLFHGGSCCVEIKKSEVKPSQKMMWKSWAFPM